MDWNSAGSIFIHWFKDKYPNMDTFQLQSLDENLVKYANVIDPTVSSDTSDDQSNPEKILSSEIEHFSDDSSSCKSLPLGQASPYYTQSILIDSLMAPTARSSSTDHAWLDASFDAAPIPNLPCYQT